MNEKPFGNFGTWSLKELIDKERSFPVGDRRGAELQAEINRRLAAESKRTASINRFVVLFTAIAAIVSIVYALDRGIFLGSDTSLVNLNGEAGIHKTCRYLFITRVRCSTWTSASWRNCPTCRYLPSSGWRPVKVSSAAM
jgi:hypothetical protein